MFESVYASPALVASDVTQSHCSHCSDDCTDISFSNVFPIIFLLMLFSALITITSCITEIIASIKAIWVWSDLREEMSRYMPNRL